MKSLSPLTGLGIFSLLVPRLTPGATDMSPAIAGSSSLYHLARGLVATHKLTNCVKEESQTDSLRYKDRKLTACATQFTEINAKKDLLPGSKGGAAAFARQYFESSFESEFKQTLPMTVLKKGKANAS